MAPILLFSSNVTRAFIGKQNILSSCELLLAKSTKSGILRSDEIEESLWLPESGAAKCLAPPLCQMFLSLFHNSHRGYLSALPLALAHINYGQLMEANMPGASRLTKSTLLRILAAQRDRTLSSDRNYCRTRYRSWDGVAEKRRDSLSRRKKKISNDATTHVTCALKR